MTQWLLHESEVAHWHALVRDAMLSANVRLTEDIESYLVFLLMRYTDAATIGSDIVSLDYLSTYHHSKTRRKIILREVGDKCLIFAGLFPGIAERRCVKASYYIKIGQSAYQHLAELNQRLESELYASLSTEFLQLKEVLHAARGLSSEQEINKLLASCPNDPKKYH